MTLLGADMVMENIAFACTVGAPFASSAFWPWWQSWWGRNIVGAEACVALAMLPRVLLLDFGMDAAWLHWARAVSLSLIAVFMAVRTVMIWHAQRRGRARG